MKKCMIILALLLLVLAGKGEAFCAQTDYMELMLCAAQEGDWERGQYAQFARDEKIDAEERTETKIAYEDLFLLARALSWPEHGTVWKYYVGEVVLNRVADPGWPDSMAEVIYQPGEWGDIHGQKLSALLPDWETARIAQRLLEGERLLDDPGVLYAGTALQGSGLCAALYEEPAGWSYFCFGDF